MDIFDAIRARHCYRGSYKDFNPNREDLVKIIESGLMAPSGKNSQTTEFVIIDNSSVIAQISTLHPQNKAMQQARAYICCVVDKNPPAVYEGLSFQIEDCAAAVENMLLAITSLGYASVWVDGWLRAEGRAEKIARLINLPDDKKIQIILPIGVPAEAVVGPKKKIFSERAWFNSYRN